MASISSAGLGSGLNVESLVTGLMSVEKQPLSRLQTQQSSYQSKISAIGTLKSALSSLQAAAKALTPTTGQTATASFSAYKATFADSTIASATASNSAVAGTYAIDVTSLATNQRLALNTTYTAGATALDFGSDSSRTLTLTLASGTTSTITLDSSQNTLTAVRDAINNANAGASASIVTDTNGKQNLLLTATTGGTASTVTLGGTATFVNPANPGTPVAAGSAFTQTLAATDAVVKIQGVSIATKGNTITSALDGIDLTVNKTGSTTLTVTRDTSDLKDKLNTFITAYNNLNSSIKSLGAYDPTSKTSAILNGDASLRTIQSQVRSALTSTPASLSGSAYQTLSSLGVSFQSDGSLKVDSTKFDKAASTDFSAVATAIGAYGSALKTTTTDLLGTSGVIASRTDGLNASVKGISKRIDAINNRLAIIEQTYRTQFTALDTTMTSMGTTSTYLTQQLALLSK